MSKPLKITKPKPKPASATETHESIEDKIAEFLKSGGKIQQIPNGVSGQEGFYGSKAKVSAK